MPETRTKRATPAAAASRARFLAPCCVHCLKHYSPRLDIGGDRIDDGVGPGEDGGDRGLVAHVGAEDRNPVQARRVQSAARAVGMPDRDAYSRSLGSEAPHEASRNPVPPNTLTVVMAFSSACVES